MRHRRVFLWCVTVLLAWKVRIADGANDSCMVNSASNQNNLCGNDDSVVKLDAHLNSGLHLKSEQHAALAHKSIQDLLPNLSIYTESIKRIKNPGCRQDAEKIYSRIQQLDIEALKMLDSTGKMTSGLLNGNVNQLGDFDQCLSINSQSDIPGKYCLAYLDIKIKDDQMNQMVHSYEPIVSNLSDPGHRVARFSTVSWGFCLPSTCSSRDLENWITDFWADNTDITIKVKVESDMCVTAEPEPYSLAKIMTIVIFLSLMGMTVIGSLLKEDDNNNKDHENMKESNLIQLLKSFSLRRNMTTLFSTSTPADDIRCLHGIRALSALALIIFHKSAAVMFNPYANRTAMAKSLGLAWSVIGRTAIIYTDSFIMISGLLTSYIFIKELDKKKKIDVKDKYWTRFFRIAPNLIAMILFCTYIMVDLGSGPQWNLVVKHHADLCKSNMWRNLLFIHNYFGFENMCLTHTHQLGIDMQLFVVSPLIIWVLWRHLKTGLVLVSTLGVLSTALRYTVAIDKQLSPVLYFGASVTQMFDTANFSYILPTHRATVYLMGVAMGLFLRRFKTVPLNKVTAFLLYAFSISMGLYAMCGPYPMARRGYVYSSEEAAYWNAFSPIMWGCMICGGIVLCSNGYGGFLDSLLSWRGFVVFTRMAYGVYLVQFPVFFYNVGSQRIPEFYTPLMLTNVGEILVILASAVVLTLLVDLPFQQIKKISWRKTQVESIKSATKENLESLIRISEREETILKQRQRHLAARVTG